MADPKQPPETEASRLQARIDRLEKDLEQVEQLRTRIVELEVELLRSRNRIAELEADTRRPREKAGAEGKKRTSDLIREIPERTIDETAKVARGVTLAYVEQLRQMADVWNAFADEVFNRNSADSRTSVRDLAWNLPRDLYSGYLSAIDRSLDIPRRTIDKFYETYNESEERAKT